MEIQPIISYADIVNFILAILGIVGSVYVYFKPRLPRCPACGHNSYITVPNTEAKWIQSEDLTYCKRKKCKNSKYNKYSVLDDQVSLFPSHVPDPTSDKFRKSSTTHVEKTKQQQQTKWKKLFSVICFRRQKSQKCSKCTSEQEKSDNVNLHRTNKTRIRSSSTLYKPVWTPKRKQQ